MLEVLEFLFASPWRYLGILVLFLVLTLWTPISITINRRDEE